MNRRMFLGSLAVAAEDWPQFRGPGGQGHSVERGLPVEWSETKNVKWKAAVPGTGWSSPSIVDGRINERGIAPAPKENSVFSHPLITFEIRIV